MNKLVAILAFAVITACGGTALAPRSVPTDRAGIKNALAASVRIRGYCNGELVGYGSGVAVSDRHVLTARHITQMCADTATPDMASFELVSPDGSVRDATGDMDAIDDSIDVGRLIVTDGHYFKTYAPIAEYTPDVPDDVFIYAGDGTMDVSEPQRLFFFKWGSVSKVWEHTILVSFHGVPGNSGAGVFDAAGHVVGILHSGNWTPTKENFVLADRPSAWVELFPPYEMPLDPGTGP